MPEPTTYRPEDNPRSLVTVPSEEQVARFQEREQELRTLVDSYNRRLAMHQSRGWADTVPELVHQMETANWWLLHAQDVSEKQLEFVRGQVRAYEHLLSLPEQVKKHREQAQAELRELRTPLEVT